MTPAPLAQLPPDLRAALLSSLEPDEQLLWTAQPGPSKRTVYDRVGSGCAIKLFGIGPIVLGIGGIWEAIRLWVPGGTVPMLIQLGLFLALAAFGCFVLYTAMELGADASSSRARTVYALTTARVLGFVDDPNATYASWHIWHGEYELMTRNLRPTGFADILFPTTRMRGRSVASEAAFIQIPNAREVAGLIEEAIASAPPRTEDHQPS